MFLSAHHLHRALVCSVLLYLTNTVVTRTFPASSDLKSKISGVEELLEEFRKQLQQEELDSREEPTDGDDCISGFQAVEERIIRASASIEQGAAFLSAPQRVFSWRDCVHSCCYHPRCTTAIIQEDLKQSDDSLRCYLFNCIYRGKNVCSFSFQPGFGTYSRANSSAPGGLATTDRPETTDRRPFNTGGEVEESLMKNLDEPPRSDAGQDLVVQLPTDWAVLDGRDSTDDHEITHYEWTLLKGNPAITMRVTHPGLLKISGLTEGIYTFQMTVSDTVGQKSSDNVSVSVLAPAPNAEVCTGHCSRYQFMCDDGCCIDIGYACDGKQHCPDRSDEDFCQNFDNAHRSGLDATKQISEKQTEAPGRTNDVPDRPKLTNQDVCGSSPAVGPCKGVYSRWYYDSASGECRHFQYGGCKGNHNNFLQKSDCENECIQKPTSVSKEKDQIVPVQNQNYPEVSKVHRMLEGHPPPESGAILPLALGLIISFLLVLMVGCRLHLIRRRLRKALPLTTEESDYLINGMYL